MKEILVQFSKLGLSIVGETIKTMISLGRKDKEVRDCISNIKNYINVRAEEEEGNQGR